MVRASRRAQQRRERQVVYQHAMLGLSPERIAANTRFKTSKVLKVLAAAGLNPTDNPSRLEEEVVLEAPLHLSRSGRLGEVYTHNRR